MGKFIFDGPNKRVHIDPLAVFGGVVRFSINELWSEWADWCVLGDNLKYLPAFRATGGDPIGGGQYVGTYMFMRNDLGWRGVPPPINPCTIIIDGSFFGEDPNQPVMENLAAQATDLIINRSSLTMAIETGGSIGPTALEIAAAVWQHSSATDLAQKMLIATYILRNKTTTNPTTGQMTVFADDGTTPILTAQLYENLNETQLYRGKGIEVRDKLV